MIEIQIGANQIKKLSSEGLPNTKLLLQNQGRDVMYIFKSAGVGSYYFNYEERT